MTDTKLSIFKVHLRGSLTTGSSNVTGHPRDKYKDIVGVGPFVGMLIKTGSGNGVNCYVDPHVGVVEHIEVSDADRDPGLGGEYTGEVDMD